MTEGLNGTDISPLPLEPLSPSPIPPIQVITASQAGLPVLLSSSSLAMRFTHDTVYRLKLLSLVILLSPSLPFSTFAPPLHPCK